MTPASHSQAVDQARAIQTVQASLVIAKKFPRDELAATAKILKACERYSLADEALYSFPRGGEAVSGPSIRLAEVIAQQWGNLEYGFRELEQQQGRSTVEAFCWDKETNTKVSREFVVRHEIGLKGGKVKHLTDERDVYEKVANHAQRRVRAAILEIVPPDVVERAVKKVNETLTKGPANVPMQDQIMACIQAFDAVQVSKELLEKRLKHPMESATPVELAELRKILNSMRDKQSRREDWFDFGTPVEGGKAAAVAAVAEETAKEEQKK